MKKLIIAILFFLVVETSYGQQQVMFTQYMFNGLALNPAYAGMHDGLSSSILWREQWTGFEGAPSTQTMTLHGPLKNSPAALGMMIIRDKIGLTEQLGGYLSASYRILLNKKTQLSFGLQGSFTNYKSELTDTFSGADPILISNSVNETKFNVGAGLLLHSDDYYIGFSSPQLLAQDFDSDNPNADAQLVRHYLLTFGKVFDLSPSVKVKPNVLFKFVKGAPVQFDLNANFLLKEIVWLGVSYRSLESIDFLFQIQITPQLQFGYSNDIATSKEIREVSNGSHEIMLNYIFKLSKNKVVTPRYF
jgi:type IX secretion system PorP/SprF family membrane protein